MRLSRLPGDLLRRVSRPDGILLYHRVVEESHDPWDLCVSPRHFAEQMEVLHDGAACVPLASFESRWRGGRSGRPRVAVTFDDGYRDNFTQALPILERFDIPVTMFIVSGSIGTEREFWWDTLERCLLRPASLPLTLEVAIRGQTHRWSFEPGSDPATPAWRADLEDPSTNRQRAFLELWSLLVELEEAERGRALATLREWSGIESGVDPDRLPLSRDELVEMSRHPLVEIGCHTASHARLPRRASATQIEEIGSCKRALEAWTGRTPRSFSYPYGAHDRSAQAAVRQLDFRLACTSRSEPVAPVESRFTLPRLQVVDQDGDAFAEWLREWFPRWLNS